MKEPILITGCARSGTSLTANIIHHAGAKGGEQYLNGTIENPTGFYENNEIDIRIDKKILRDNGFDIRGQKKLPDHNLQGYDVREKVFRMMKEQGVGVDDNWYFKDAKALLIQQTFLMSFPEAKWILVRRDIDDIIDSCMRANFMSDRNTVGEWYDWVIHYFKLMDKLKERTENWLDVHYENLMNENYEEIKGVIEWLGLEYNEKYIDKIVIRK